MKTLITSYALCIILTASGATQAALIDRGGGLIYDSELNITWLAGSQSFGSWDQVMAWANNIEYYDSVRQVTYSDWRLPTAASYCDPNYHLGLGPWCGTSEFGHLFDDLGGLVGQPIDSSPLFPLIQPWNYWSGTEAPNTTSALYIDFSSGIHNVVDKIGMASAIAVRPGDVAAVPAPAALWLLGSGLLGLIGVARRKAA